MIFGKNVSRLGYYFFNLSHVIYHKIFGKSRVMLGAGGTGKIISKGRVGKGERGKGTGTPMLLSNYPFYATSSLS